MSEWKSFLIRVFDTNESSGGFYQSIQSILSECQIFFPGFRITFWTVNVRKNELKIFRCENGNLKNEELALSQFKFDHMLRSRERPLYAFQSRNQIRVLIPLFVDGILGGCLAVSAHKKRSIKSWKHRLPYFYIVAKRFLKVLELNIKNTAIDTLIELNQGLEEKVSEQSISLEQEKLAHMQAGKMATLGEVAVGISHEINNPLTVIAARIGYLEKILEKKNMLIPEVVDSIKRITQTVERIVRIINGLKYFSHSGSDKKTLVSLSRIISDTTDLCQERLRRTDVELRVLSAGFDVEISVSDTQIVQVLLNLIINSLDAIQSLSDRWIEIEYKIEQENLNIIVRDSGAGLLPEVASKIMNPFYTTKARDQGTGLGLSLSKTIIENHEGRLFYNSHAKNTEFVIELPYMRLLKNETQM